MTKSTSPAALSTSNSAKSARATGPVECQPWCQDHNGHWLTPGAAYVPLVEDQYCTSAESMFELSHGPADGPADEIGLFLVDDHGTRYIGINPDFVNGMWRLTADKADALAAMITSMAGKLREGGPTGE